MEFVFGLTFAPRVQSNYVYHAVCMLNPLVELEPLLRTLDKPVLHVCTIFIASGVCFRWGRGEDIDPVNSRVFCVCCRREMLFEVKLLASHHDDLDFGERGISTTKLCFTVLCLNINHYIIVRKM